MLHLGVCLLVWICIKFKMQTMARKLPTIFRFFYVMSSQVMCVQLNEFVKFVLYFCWWTFALKYFLNSFFHRNRVFIQSTYKHVCIILHHFIMECSRHFTFFIHHFFFVNVYLYLTAILFLFFEGFYLVYDFFSIMWRALEWKFCNFHVNGFEYFWRK